MMMIVDKSTVGFVQVLMLVISRGFLYALVQLSARNWLKLRQNLTRIEFRTILGATLFPTLSDLVFLATEKVNKFDILPMCTIQIAAWMMAAWRTIQQGRQICAFRGQLRGRPRRSVEEKMRKYGLFGIYHAICLLWLGSLIVLDLLLMMTVLMDMVDAVQAYTVVQQIVATVSFVFWSACNFANLL